MLIHGLKDGCWCFPYLKEKQFLRSWKPRDSIDKNSNFTSQNTGVAGLQLPRSVSLFVLLCDFGVLKD